MQSAQPQKRTPQAMTMARRLFAAGKLAEAERICRRVLQARPQTAWALHLLGLIAQRAGKSEAAARRIGEAIALRPDFVQAHLDLGNLHREKDRLEEAIPCYEKAVQLQPDLAEAHTQLGYALRRVGKLEEALASCERALALRPDSAEAHNNRGHVLTKLGRCDEAVASFQRAIALVPAFVDAHLGLATVWLLMGKYEEGLVEYEWRWKHKGFMKGEFRTPLWDGAPLEGKKILLNVEQGFGDTLQFIRYAPLLQAHGGFVILAAQAGLIRLLKSCAGIDLLVEQGATMPKPDVRAPILSLPGIFKTTLETIPSEVPYLFAETELIEKWRSELEGMCEFKVGIAWQGNPQFKGDHHRSIPLAHYAPLAVVEGVRLFSLQKNYGLEQLRELEGRFRITDVGAQCETFAETAAAMKCMDLIITSDTSIAHAAGALGVPTWVALQFAPDWRWLLEREDCPWYPTMRLFRQKEFGDWEDVFARIAVALRERIVAGA